MKAIVGKWMWPVEQLFAAILASTFATQQASAQSNEIQPIQ